MTQIESERQAFANYFQTLCRQSRDELASSLRLTDNEVLKLSDAIRTDVAGITNNCRELAEFIEEHGYLGLMRMSASLYPFFTNHATRAVNMAKKYTTASCPIAVLLGHPPVFHFSNVCKRLGILWKVSDFDRLCAMDTSTNLVQEVWASLNSIMQQDPALTQPLMRRRCNQLSVQCVGIYMLAHIKEKPARRSQDASQVKQPAVITPSKTQSKQPASKVQAMPKNPQEIQLLGNTSPRYPM